MMKNIVCLLITALACLSCPVLAGTIQIGGQWDVPPGQNNQLTCISPPSGNQCLTVPGRIIGWSGTQTVKQPGIELLAGVVCNNQALWTGEQLKGTLVFASPANIPTDLPTDCMVIWETTNSGSYCWSCWELNMTIFYCIPGMDCPRN